jgi:hypothetical protein
MRLLLKDKPGRIYVVNSDEHRPQTRGGRGKKLFTNGAFTVVPTLQVQLLPDQVLILTCPACLETRSFSTPGPRAVHQHCGKCLAKAG